MERYELTRCNTINLRMVKLPFLISELQANLGDQS